MRGSRCRRFRASSNRLPKESTAHTKEGLWVARLTAAWKLKLRGSYGRHLPLRA